ncbi:MAG: precorrin-6y C5,15-methyltransferase (decarboxylating) subunit CbiE [Ardenticatenia bacterium]|nr:precorrin-6y C5,15-methyltransferase (decarboxylating) subunit CbiE [Ardenticatenia bacterium]
MKANTSPVLVVGVTEAGPSGLPPHLVRRVHQADLLVGGARHLAMFPEAGRERIPFTTNVAEVVERLRRALEQGERAVVLASGDPLCYGIGATLRRYLAPEELEIIPAPSAFQLAFAALAEPWHDAVLLSAHGRPLEDVVARLRAARVGAVLTDAANTPAVIARALVAAGVAPETRCAVCERLGGPRQRVVRGTLAEVAAGTFDPLNVFVVWPEIPLRRWHTPLPDGAFVTVGGQFTKREVRALAVAALDLRPGEVLWDIGAGSGAVSLEAAYRHPDVAIYAVERRPELVACAHQNLARFPAPNVQLVAGEAPHACTSWPDPDAIFLGGTGGRLEELVTWARRRLRPAGRLVVNLVVVEHVVRLRRLLPDADIVQVAVSRGVDIRGHLRFQALNPVFIVTWRKTTRGAPDPSGGEACLRHCTSPL